MLQMLEKEKEKKRIADRSCDHHPSLVFLLSGFCCCCCFFYILVSSQYSLVGFLFFFAVVAVSHSRVCVCVFLSFFFERFCE